MTIFTDTFQTLEHVQTIELVGTVAEVRGLTLRVSDLALPVGGTVLVEAHGQRMPGEVVGFDADKTVVMPLGFTTGIRRGDRVIGQESAPMARVGEALLGRVINGLGQPIDGQGPLRQTLGWPLQPKPVDPLQRVPIDTPLGSGVRCLDTMLTVGRGQRLGIFAGPGVGKSTLMGTIARQTDADVSVIALVGERGREVRDFLDESLGEEGLARSVVVVATGDEPPLLRIRAAMMATSVAEFFRARGLDVVLMMDSVTRFCQAQRQVGLAAGEPPATKGYPPSVFAMLPALLERSGRTEQGSITGFYTVLVEGDDMTEPISDAARGILDGHVELSRDLANRAHYPAIDVLHSVSRVARAVTDRQQQAARNEIIRLMSAYREVEDLVNIGAYAAGSNPTYDLAIAMKEQIDAMLQQGPEDRIEFDKARRDLLQLALKTGQQAQAIQKRQGGTRTG